MAVLMVLILVGGGATYATAKIRNQQIIYLIEKEIEVEGYNIYVDYLKVTPKEYTLYVRESEDLETLLQLYAIVSLDENKNIVMDEDGNMIFERFFDKSDNEIFQRVWKEGNAVYDVIFAVDLYANCGDLDRREIRILKNGKWMSIGGNGKVAGEGGLIEDGYWSFTWYFSRTRNDIDQIDYLGFAGQILDLSDCKVIR